MIHRRTFLVSVAGLLALPAAATAQEARPWRIGYLSLVSEGVEHGWRAAC
jgi:hypothetical protein